MIYYPDQKTDEAPAPYPYAIAMRGNNPAVLQVELLNPYNGIDATKNNRHLIRDVSGQPLRRGDLRRRHLRHRPHRKRPLQPLVEHAAQGSSTGRWKTAKPSSSGEPTGNMCSTRSASATASDTASSRPRTACAMATSWAWAPTIAYTAVVVDASPRFGILITNGEFVSFHGPDPTMVAVGQANFGLGAVRELRVLGPVQPDRAHRRPRHGRLQRLHLHAVGRQERRPCAAVQVQSGSVVIRGCEFQEDKPQIELGEKVRRAVISDNLLKGRERIANNSKGVVKIANNAANEP